MYKVTIYYRISDSDELRFVTLYGVYLNQSILTWIASFENLSYILVDKLNKEDK